MPFKTVNAQWATARFAGRDLRAKNTFSTVEPARNRFLVGDYIPTLGGGFSHTSRTALTAGNRQVQAVSNFNQHANYEGQQLIWNRADSGFLTSYHPSQGKPGDRPGPLAVKFTASADQYLAFLIAGGNTQRESGCACSPMATETAVWRGMKILNASSLIVHPFGHLAGKASATATLRLRAW